MLLGLIQIATDSIVGDICILVAALLSGLVPTWVSNKRTQRRVEDLHDEVRTNHGRKPSEYLEMVADVQTGVNMLNGQVEGVARMVGRQGVEFAEILRLHTVEDQERFDRIIERLDALDSDGLGV